VEIFKPEMCAFPLRAYVDATREAIGSDALEAMLLPYGIDSSGFEDPTAWYSLEFVEAFIRDMLERCNEPGYLERATRLGMTPKYLGALFPLFRALGSPLFAFQQEARAAARFNRCGTWSLLEGRPGFARVAFLPLDGAPRETKDYICRIRIIQQGLIPTLFDKPPGRVEHPQCMLRGDHACVYEITWRDDGARANSGWGLLAGGVAGAAGAALFGAELEPTLLVSAVSGMGVWALASLVATRRDLAARVGEIVDHNQALAVLTRTNEDRYAELLEAKRGVEQKVEERTVELRDASQRLSETLEKLQALDRQKTDFFNNVSHELRSPLTLILAPLQELLEGRTPAANARGAYEVMHRNASRLLRLINQLLDLAKIDAGLMTITRSPTDLVELVKSAVRGFEAAAKRKGVTLEIHTPERAPASLLLDAAWIDSALTNLIANALRLTRTGAGVRIGVTDAPDHMTLSVSDDGPGIAPQDHAKVFERFAQGDSTKRVVGGTGIGLALVREAARLHGGEVALDSALGRGATFTITLPRVQEAFPARTPPLTATQPPPALLIEEVEDRVDKADRDGPSPSATLVLVVEDNPELRTFIADALSSRYRVRAAQHGEQALEMMRTVRPDVIVSDVAMPEMDGYELCRRIRANDETKSVPVLLVTARTEQSSVLEGFEAGANDYVLKPFHATELLARVDVHVRLRRLTGQLARQERLAALGSLAATMAHNVRNPLSALISGLPAIRSRLGGAVDKSTDELLGIMLDCAVRIERMTIDLLDLSRIDREVSGEFAPGAGLLACTRMFASRIGPDVELRTDVDDQITTSGRAGDVNHVFMNVIDNALRAVGAKGCIEIRAKLEDDYYTVVVADSGPGIASDARERVFEPFWTTRAAGEGTGLGLSIARQIVDEHAGSISADASALGGAQFTIRLPLRKPTRAVA
jgi:signal transduction histidine kinase